MPLGDALLPGATRAQARAVLGAMRAVAATGGAPSGMAEAALAGADHWIFGHDPPIDAAALPAIGPATLATVATSSDGSTVACHRPAA